MFETSVTVVGNVVTEPTARELPSGDRVVSFRLGSTARRFDRTTQRWVDGDHVFATVNCWRRVAEGVCGTVHKSSPVVVAGRLRTRDYETGGQWRSVVEIEANAVGLDVARGSPPPSEPATREPPAAIGDPESNG